MTVRALYIAGPMTGIPEFNYPAFREAEISLLAAGYAALNPASIEAYNPTPGIPQEWRWYMRHALRMVSNCDALALLPGWEKSRGAKLEVQVASALELPIRMVDEWIEAAA